MAASKILSPREGSQFISSIAKDVKVSKTGIEKLARVMKESLVKEPYTFKTWKSHEVNPQTVDEKTADWIFFLDTLNFSFWSEDTEKKCIVQYKGKDYTGYFSLCAAVKRAYDDGINITDPAFYASMSLGTLQHLFRSDTPYPMPLLAERLNIINQTGQTLLKEFGGSFTNCLKQCDKNAQKLMELVLQHFPSYRDVSSYGDYKVGFYKRLQILVADLWACFEGRGLGKFEDIDELTMFADYRIPQALVYFGALEYSDDLRKKLGEKYLFSSGERLEVEIRAGSIHAVELLKAELLKLFDQEESTTNGQIINSIIMDFYLWDYRRLHCEEVDKVPFHRVRCIYY